VDLRWSGGKATSGLVRAEHAGSYKFRAPKRQTILGISAGSERENVVKQKDGSVVAHLERGRVYRVAFA